MNGQLCMPLDWPYVACEGTSSGLAYSHVVVPVCMSVMALSGATGTMFVVDSSTTLERSTIWTGSTQTTADLATASTADAVRELRRVSGLTWEELARMFGVSRRAVHNWAAGGTLNSRNSQLLSTLVRHIGELDRGSAEATRAGLMAPSLNGRSRYYEIVALSRRDITRAPEGTRPAQLLDARHDGKDSTGELIDFEPDDGGAAGR